MLNVRLPEGLEKQLEHLAAETGRSKSFYVKKALEQYLEDMYDTLLAVDSLAKSKKTYTLEQARKKLGLED
jgi:RHH-type rel operon transcriptional repressor/antitoxin RelB